MRILFIGTVEFSRQALQKLIQLNANIVGIATKSQSKYNADFTDLSDIAKKQGIPYRYIKDINSEKNLDWVSGINPDVIFCFGWPNLLKNELLNLPAKGVLGYHPAKLPYNRGRHPIIWALALGLEETASTFFFMDEGADSGPILSQKDVSIEFKDDAKGLYDKTIDTAISQIEEFLPDLIQDTYQVTQQNEYLANTWRKRGKEDGKIDFRMSTEAIYNLVRALTKPYVGAHIETNDGDIKVWKAKPSIDKYPNNLEPGKVLELKGEKTIVVKTYDGAIELWEHNFEILPSVNGYL